MRFAIDNGLPYLVSNGKAYPVEINGDNVRVDFDSAALTDLGGAYTLAEIHAKCGVNASSIVKKAEPTAETGKRKTKK